MKKILHCDANNFYASIECMLDPTLKDKYVAVSGNPDKRHGIILAKNQKAKECGIKTGEVIWEAKRKCPQLVLVPPQFDKYVYYSDKIFDIYCQYTDRVEPFGIDECWLDVTGSMRLFKSATAIANELRERIKKEIGITISVGVSFNKVFAKLGSDMKKPDATTLISPDNFKSKVWGLDVSDMLMIGKKTANKLNELGINTIGDLANTDVRMLVSKFGVNGQKMYDNANGLGDEEVRLYYDKHIPKSIGNSTTMPKDVISRDEIKAVVMALSEMVAIRLRKYGFVAGGVHFGMRFNDLNYVSKQCKLPYKVNSASSICDFAMDIYDSFKNTVPLRLISVTTFDLSKGDEIQQMSFFDDEKTQKLRRIDASLDKIRQKYGYNALKSASLLEYPFVTDGLEDSDFLPFKK